VKLCQAAPEGLTKGLKHAPEEFQWSGDSGHSMVDFTHYRFKGDKLDIHLSVTGILSKNNLNLY